MAVGRWKKNKKQMKIVRYNPHFASNYELRTTNSQGTATVEFVMAIPLLVLVIAGTFFLGWVMRNHQRLRVADRYAAWRNVHASTPSSEQVNEEFFDGRGIDIRLRSDAGDPRILETWVGTVQTDSEDAGDLVENLVFSFRVPRGSGMTVETKFDTNNAFWKKLADSPMDSRHVREGRDWVRGEVNVGEAMRDLYFGDLEQAVKQTAGTSISESLRNLYRYGW